VLKDHGGVIVIIGGDETTLRKESLDSFPPSPVPWCHDGPVNALRIGSGAIQLIFIVYTPQFLVVLCSR
jgi:hypothetical protein